MLSVEQMAFRVEVRRRAQFPDARAAGIQGDIAALGIQYPPSVTVIDLYFLLGALDDVTVERICRELLCDAVVESNRWTRLDGDEVSQVSDSTESCWAVEVALLPGVTDSQAESLVQAARLIGIPQLEQAATAHRYELEGDLKWEDVEKIAMGLLANATIQTYSIRQAIAPPFLLTGESDDTVERIMLRELDDGELTALSKNRRLSLDQTEMRAIACHYREAGREPTDVELETLAQTWSEHCVHKTFKAWIEYEGPEGNQQIDGLLHTYIQAATEEINAPWVRSAFVDNAGIVAFDDFDDIALKVETHNHPSAIEPFGGANTGIGGVVRDILGVSARPIANTDVLCFGPTDLPFDRLPEGVLHPRRVENGVVAGIEDYGNKMGIPTVGGAILYDAGYTANALVFCGCFGILPRGSHRRGAQAEDHVVVIGGRTGRDGLRGATFSSDVLAAETGSIAGSSVQIGHPIREKQVLEVVLRARDAGLYHAITDCGAGGLSSAVGEMGSEVGAKVELSQVKLKYAGLRPWEIWLSEAQERMVLAVPDEHWAQLQEICQSLDCEATSIGRFTDDGQLRLLWHGDTVGDLAMEFLHGGLPRRRMRAAWTPPSPESVQLDSPSLGVADTLRALMSHPNIRSKEWAIRRYDHEVQGGTVVKPLVGVAADGPSDAAVLWPLDAARRKQRRGIAIGHGICPAYSALDPYRMAWAAVDEAVRNVVAVGGDPSHIALLDNFCWGDPTQPDRLGGLVRACMGCYDAAVELGAPFVSGKDSLNNEYLGPDGKRIPIPGTLLITALAPVPDVAQSVTMSLKEQGNLLYVLGETRGELGGSHYQKVSGGISGVVPAPSQASAVTVQALHEAMQQGLVRSCHDLSEGGLGVSAAEMCIAGRLGMWLDLRQLPKSDGVNDNAVALYSESLGRFLVEVTPAQAQAFEITVTGIPHAVVGRVTTNNLFEVAGLEGAPVIREKVEVLVRIWKGEGAQ